MLADYHVHTDFSDDSFYPMKDVIKDAISLNLNELCFTDHVDYGIKGDWDSEKEIPYRNGKLLANVDYPLYAAFIQEYKYLYGDKITIKMGLEFGMQVNTIPKFEKIFAQYPFDFIILSVHQIADKEFWTQDFQRGRSQKEYNECYYYELLEIIKRFKNYCVLGHMDLITRYDQTGCYPFEKVESIITDILNIIISDGKGIEINTSSHRYGLQDLSPSRDILRLYQKLGGEIITIGSDCHKKEHLGAHIQETKQELIKLGFQKYCTYDKMKPIYHDLSVE